MSARIDIPVTGGKLAVYRLGSQRSEVPSVLAVHGITATSFAWLAVTAALADDVSLIAVDLRGRGESRFLPGPFGFDAHVEDLVAVLDTLELSRSVVVGHSLGAYIAAQLGAQHPDRVSRLVLVDGGLTIPGTADVDPEPFMRAFLGPALARLEMTFETVEAYVEWWLQHPAISGSDVDLDVLRGYAGHDLVGDPPVLRSSVNPDVLRPDGGDVLRSDDAHRLAAAGGAAVCASRHGQRPQPDAATRTRPGLGRRGPGATPRVPSARRQPLHDHARGGRRRRGRRRGPRSGCGLAQPEQHVDDELVEPLVAVAAAGELVKRRRL